MCDKNELSCLDRRLVFYDAVFGNAEAEQSCTQSAESPHNDCSFQGRDDPGDNGASSNNGPDAGDNQKRRTEKHSPEPAPKCAPFAPVFHSVACVVETDDIFFRLIIAADDGQLLDVKPATLQLLDGIFCCGVLTENRNNRVLVLCWHVTHLRLLNSHIQNLSASIAIGFALVEVYLACCTHLGPQEIR